MSVVWFKEVTRVHTVVALQAATAGREAEMEMEVIYWRLYCAVVCYQIRLLLDYFGTQHKQNNAS